ncbi:ATP-dependent DNA helicase II subunit 2 [Gryganskiella cystojenkinii]|nr:ATP-dependent DNA helicase II subunit 2 [Gryganskiella cystojenkinii]
MASKEATVYILDVGTTMRTKREGKNVTRLEETKDVLLKLLANKVHMARKTVYVAVVLVGSDDTNNELATVDDEGNADYQNVDVLRGLGVATLDLMKGVQNDVKIGEVMGDCVDGLIVSLDMITKFCKKLKYEKKIYILTDASSPINDDGTDAIMTTLKEDNIQLNVIGTDFDDETEEVVKTDMQAQNEEFYKGLCNNTGGDVFSLNEAVELTSQFYTKKIKPTATYRGVLNLGDPENHPDAALSIPVHMFPSTMLARFPNAKKYSVLSESAVLDELPEGRTGLVNLSRTYKLKVTADMASGDMDVDEAQEVPQDALEKAYMYGKTIVPIRAVDIEAYKLRTAKSLTILGFFSASTFRREWLMSNIYSLFPAPGDTRAEVDMLGLLFALFEKDSYALVRYVRAEDAEPKLGILWPEITEEHKCFYYGQVAFSEDVRRYLFSSLTDIRTASGKKLDKHRLLATEESIAACKEFIGAMDLMQADHGEEYLKPESTFNPSTQRQKQALEFRALNADKELPPIPDALISQLIPKQDLLADAQPLADKLIQLWDIKKVDQTKRKRGYGASLDDEGGEKDGVATASGVDGTSTASLIDSLTGGGQHSNKRSKSESVFGTATPSTASGAVGISGQAGLGGDIAASGMIPFEMSAVREVGTSDPVKDFQAMVRIATIQSQQGVRPAGAGFISVSMAVDQMKAMINKLYTTSFGDQLYEKAVDCLKSLRQFLADIDLADKVNGGTGIDDKNATNISEKTKETIKSRVETWNSFIKEVKAHCLNTAVSPQRTDFWDLIIKYKKELGLLTDMDVPDGCGGATGEEAEQLWEVTSDVDLLASAEEQEGVDEDDLLALMD